MKIAELKKSVALMEAETEAEERITVEKMQYLKEARDPDDDWTGMTLRAERKKRQNRLNQRSYSKRLHFTFPHSSSVLVLQLLTIQGRRKHLQQLSSSPTSSELPESELPESDRSPSCSHYPTSKSPLAVFRKDSPFPASLSTDHLMLLVQYNFYRGCFSNMVLAGVNADDHANGVLILSSPVPHSPPTLEPTLLQRTVMHAAWIDSVPHADLRDRFIRQIGKYDPEEYWSDLIGDLHISLEGTEEKKEGKEKEEKLKKREFGRECMGVVCWDTPWTIEGYEFTARHLRKWGWMYGRCEAIIIKNSNRWRAKRGEAPLVLEKIMDVK